MFPATLLFLDLKQQRGWKMNVFNYFMLINHSGLLSSDMCKPFPSRV